MQRDTWGKWALIVALVLVIVSGVAMILSLQHRETLVSIGGQLVHARVAATPEQRKQGLSGTKSLGDNKGMLFVYEVPGRWGIWMKDMNYSIDIVWMDGHKRVVHTERNVSPDTYPKAFLPDKDASYVLELPAGFCDRYSVNDGQVVGFSVN